MFITLAAPTLHPSAEQFDNPIKYLSSPEIIAVGKKYGILKIRPPQGWQPRFALDRKRFSFHTRLQDLKDLSLINRSRDFFFQGFNNYLKMRGKNPLKSSKNRRRGRKQKHPLTTSDLPKDYDGFLTLIDGQRTHIFDIFNENDFKKYSYLIKDRELLKDLIRYSKYLQNEKKEEPPKFENDLSLRELLENDIGSLADSKNGCVLCHLDSDPSRTLLCDGCDRSFHMSCLDHPLKTIPKSKWFCKDCLDGTNGDYGFEEDYDNIFTLKEFEEDCKEVKDDYCDSHFSENRNPSVDILEKEFWSLVSHPSNDKTSGVEVRYGADIHNEEKDQVSGFPTTENFLVDTEKEAYYIRHPFNLTQLPFADGSLLNYIKSEDRKQISGMTVPWLYVGSMFSTFCWHKEDHYTMSANYCHLGSTKKWYAIPACDCEKFESLCRKISPAYFDKQPGLLHQLVTLVSPEEIEKEQSDKPESKKVHIFSVDQGPNEFVITFPKVYHAGFNCGFNVNEAVNFTMPYWLEYGEQSIQEYRRVKKENVFNYYKLLRNIMDDNLASGGVQLTKSKEMFTEQVVSSMLKQSLRNYKNCVNKFGEVMKNDTLNKFLEGLPIEKYQNYVKEKLRREDERKTKRYHGRGDVYRMNPSRASEDYPDEYICHDCKSFVNFQWVEVDLLKELEGIQNALEVIEIKHEDNQQQLPTPNQTPEQVQKSKFGDFESEWTQIIRKAREESEEKDTRRRLRKHKSDVTGHHSLLGETTSSCKRMKLVSRMKHKRIKHANYGKIIFCMDCLSKELSHLNPDYLNRLKLSTTLYDDSNLMELQDYINNVLEPEINKTI
ncbi:hypothetical protein FOA43_003377 [Brettanomyces nanus]|uniref:Uncharacterized protein n=1 Tax=Eeniella nana TaxID=13502 RepID=A0A875S2Q2_EENNA|nr:uncharacterized protein FOA43_003377 [Brettanomyces nanus]QPG75991.1 hypothetical protein FOA43_003377 [Brettanomyces nanus]